MKILYESNLVSKLSNHTFLFLDTTAFVTAFNYEEFGELLKNIKDNNCDLLTIPSVVFEFTRGSDSLESYNRRVEYINHLVSVYPIERHLEELQGIMVAFQKIGGLSYTDFLLSACLYKFKGALLLTENHTHFPPAIFDKVSIVTVDTGKDIRNHVVYSLSEVKFEKAVANILPS